MWFEHSIVGWLNRMNQPLQLPPMAGLTLGHLTDNPSHAVVWAHNRRAEHACVVGKTGSGKTHFMEYLAWQLMSQNEPFVFLDYHGDATDHLVRLAARSPEGAARLLIVDPTDPHVSPGLNPLETMDADERSVFGRASELSAILRQRWGVEAFGARTEELLRNTLFVLAATHQTLVEAPRLLTSPEFRAQLVSQITHPEVLDYWHDRYEPLSEAMKGAFREPLLNKVTAFLTEPACRHLLGQRQSTINFAAAINEGRWIVVNLAKGKLREHAHTLGNLIFARLQFDILARANVAPERRRLFTVFCDEVQNLAENDLATLLAEGRKFQVSLTTGHQYWDQLSHELRGALLSAGTHVFFRLSSSDAGILASELSVGAKQRYHRELTLLARGQAVGRVGSGAPVTFTVPPLPSIRTSADRIRALRDVAVQRCSRSRDQVEADIRARRDIVRVVTRPAPVTHDANDGQHGW